jgi:hypothetical protein
MSDTLFENCIGGDMSNWQAYGTTWVCQTFTPQVTHRITSVKLYCMKGSSGSTGNAVVSIQAVTGADNHPAGSDLTDAVVVACSSLPANGSPDWKEWTFSSPVVLTKLVRYAIVIRAPDAASNYGIVCKYDTPSLYGTGEAGQSANSGSTWDMYSGLFDIYFQEYGLEIESGKKQSPVSLNTNWGW